MTSPRTNPAPRTLDVSQTARVPFGRLLSVELRKMADTRSGRWLLGAIVLITAAIMVLFLVFAEPDERLFGNFAGIAATPQGFLLPVLGILLVTTEWSQRTAMVTFALEPSRSRVMAAKTAAALTFGLLAFLAAIVLAAACTVVGGSDDGFGGLTVSVLGLFLLLQLLTVLQGLAYGMILLNTPAAIVVFFALPIASSIVFALVPALEGSAPWVDLGTAQAPLFEFDSGSASLTGEQWARLGTTTALWILLPYAAGLARIRRAELK